MAKILVIIERGETSYGAYSPDVPEMCRRRRYNKRSRAAYEVGSTITFTDDARGTFTLTGISNGC